MLNTLIVYDDRDESLGEYFNDCYLLSHQILTTVGDINIDQLNGLSLNDASFNIKTQIYNHSPYVFISYSHGSESELLKSGVMPFVSTVLNHDSLSNSLSYCYACHAGSHFGERIIENGAICFVGYRESVKIQLYFGARQHFIECAISGITPFIEGRNIDEVIKKMKEVHNEKIDLFYKTDMLTASLFLHNRDALVAHGNKGLSIDHFLS